MLELHAVGPLTHRVGSGGKYIVESGSWIDAFTGRVFRDVDAQVMQIDHVIPVMWACDHGADTWTRERKREFYNDMDYLMVVEAGMNRFKGAKGPDDFLPLNKRRACTYVTVFLDGVAEYGLMLSTKEQQSILSEHELLCGTEIAMN